MLDITKKEKFKYQYIGLTEPLLKSRPVKKKELEIQLFLFI